MRIIKKLYIVGLWITIQSFLNADKYYLCFNDDFLSLLRIQKDRYLTEQSKKIMDRGTKYMKDLNKSFTEAMCYYGIPKNLGEVYDLGIKAYIYTQAQDNAICFDKTYCEKILETLEKYLKKTFVEYKNIIFYYELAPISLNTSKEEYNECKAFMEYFNGFEEKPLEKLGNIFKRKETTCTIL